LGSTGSYAITTIVGVMGLISAFVYSIAKYNEINKEYTKILVNFSSGVYITLLAGAIRSEILSQDEIYKIGTVVFKRKFDVNERYEIINQVWQGKEAINRPLRQPVQLLKELSSNIAEYPTISSMKARVSELFEENLLIQMSASSTTNTGGWMVYFDILQGYMISNPYISIGAGLLIMMMTKYILSSSIGVNSWQMKATQDSIDSLVKRVDLLENKQVEELNTMGSLLYQLTNAKDLNESELVKLTKVVVKLSILLDGDIVTRLGSAESDIFNIKEILGVLCKKFSINVEQEQLSGLSERFAPFAGTGFKLGETTENIPVIKRKADER
jgi:hypothetical protein